MANVQFNKPGRWVNKVYLHASASDFPQHDNIETMDKWHKARGWSGVGYHYFICKDGTLQVGRSVERVPAAQGGNNRGTIAICCHGLAEEKFTHRQFRTLRELCRQINNAYDGKITFHGHCEVSNKDCPVFDYKAVLNLRNGHLGIVADDNVDWVEPATAEQVARKVVVAGVGDRELYITMRGQDVKWVQELLGIAADEIFGQQTKKAVMRFQEDTGLRIDGWVGSDTWHELKEYAKGM